MVPLCSGRTRLAMLGPSVATGACMALTVICDACDGGVNAIGSTGVAGGAGVEAAQLWKPCLCLCFGFFLQITNSFPRRLTS